jgi:hypothetical protein
MRGSGTSPRYRAGHDDPGRVGRPLPTTIVTVPSSDAAGDPRHPAVFDAVESGEIRSDFLRTVARASIAACASAARSSGDSWPIVATSSPAAARSSASMLSRLDRGGACGPHEQLESRGSVVTSGVFGRQLVQP